MNRKVEYSRRSEYNRSRLVEAECPENPMDLLDKWLKLAIESGHWDMSMVLSTVGTNGQPSSRVVLLRERKDKGIVFFTNYNSRKGRELEANPLAAINFYWEALEKQLRLEGRIEKLPAGESDKYFNARPLESRISAVVSPQSEKIPDRSFLEFRHKEMKDTFQAGTGKLIRPENWGGFIFYPDVIEFWQGRPGRLHDRIEYRLDDETWKMMRLAP